jgi:hypothetical protein
MRDEVRSILSQELQFYRGVVLLLAAVLGVVFTVLGWTTYKDIQDQVKESVEKLINRTDYETIVKRTLDRLVGRSAMIASLIALHRPEARPSDEEFALGAQARNREVNLSFDDWTRLQKWIQDESLEQQDFSGTLMVLAAQDEERARQDASSFLGEMLNPSVGSRFAWVRKHPAKRLAILRNFIRPGLESQAMDIAKSEESPRELRFAALEYVKRVGYREGFDELRALVAPDKDDELAFRALLTCATLDPINGLIEQESAKIIAGKGLSRSVEKATRLATAIWEAPSSTSDKIPQAVRDEVAENREELSRKLLSYAFDNNSRVVVLSDDNVAIIVRSEIGPDEQAFLKPKETFAKFTPYWNLMNDAVKMGSVARISSLAPWSATRQGLESLQLNLSETARVKVAIGARSQVVELSESTSIGRLLLARLESAERRGLDKLTVLWTDGEGRRLQGELIGLSGDGFDVSLVKDAQ